MKLYLHSPFPIDTKVIPISELKTLRRSCSPYVGRRIELLDKLNKENLSIQQAEELIQPLKQLDKFEPFFYTGIHIEIRERVLQIKDEFELKKYLHYLLKVYKEELSSVSYMEKYKDRIQAFLDEHFPTSDEKTEAVENSDLYNYLVDGGTVAILICSIIEYLGTSIMEEFGLDESEFLAIHNDDKWDRIKIPPFKRLSSFIQEDTTAPQNQTANGNSEDEQLPEFEYESAVQKVAWLHELGILSLVLEQCKVDGITYNWSRAGNIIESFTGIHAKNTIIPCLRAIFNTTETNKHNNPFNNPENILFVQTMRQKFKLEKVKVSKEN